MAEIAGSKTDLGLGSRQAVPDGGGMFKMKMPNGNGKVQLLSNDADSDTDYAIEDVFEKSGEFITRYFPDAAYYINIRVLVANEDGIDADIV